jgi:hypothetical protein
MSVPVLAADLVRRQVSVKTDLVTAITAKPAEDHAFQQSTFLCSPSHPGASIAA